MTDTPLWYYKCEVCKAAYDMISSGIIPESGIMVMGSGLSHLYMPAYDRYYMLSFSSGDKYYWKYEEINKFTYDYVRRNQND